MSVGLGLTDALDSLVEPVVDRLTECGIGPVEVAAHVAYRTFDRVMDKLAALEEALPFVVMTDKRQQEAVMTAFRFGREAGRLEGPQEPERLAPVRHLQLVKAAKA